MSSELTFEAFEKEWLVDIVSGSPSKIELGRRFSKKLVSQWLDFAEDIESPDDVVYCDGTGDGGIDIACLQRGDDAEDNSYGGDTWYLVQSKYGSAFVGTKTLIEEAQKLPNNIEYELTEPFVVNGCQTTRTIWEVLYRKLEAGGTGKNPELETWKRNLVKGIVVIKIVKVGIRGDELLTETTRYTNSQNAVSEKDFIALESDFQKWSKNMASRYNVFLEIQRGGWDSQKAYQKQNPDTKQFSECINAFDLLKVYGAAWLGEAGISFGKNPPFAPGGNLFHKIVKQEDFGLDDLYAAFQLYKAGGRFKFGRGAEKQQRGQTRYLFYMLTVELLKDCFIAADRLATNKSSTNAF